jgi:hypothetical protein
VSTFDERMDDAEAQLAQLGAAGRRDHETALGKLGAPVDLLDAHVQASFAAADAGEGPETREMQQQLAAVRSEYDELTHAHGDAHAAHRHALADALARLKRSWHRAREHGRAHERG